MPLIAKSPTDRFLNEFVTHLFECAYTAQDYIDEPIDWWIKDRIDEINWKREDQLRAYAIVGGVCKFD